MRFLAILFFVICSLLKAQTLKQCRERFDTYLNFHGSLNACLKFNGESFSLLGPQGKKEYTIYEEELPVLALFLEKSTVEQQEVFFSKKGNHKLSATRLDSLKKANAGRAAQPADPQKPLLGLTIAIDPGHFATNLTDAQVEQKFLYFAVNTPGSARDSVKIFESQLTFQTALILKEMLLAKGATVFMSREAADHTSFGCNFRDWMRWYKKQTLDSLVKVGAMPTAKYKKLLSCNDYQFFWDFFRDYDLANRAKKINKAQPDLTVIIHYNVDEKNAPWKQHSPKNFSMTFIGGAFTADNLAKNENKMHFLRMLSTDQLNRSEQLSAKTVGCFNKVLGIPIARSHDATYLKDNCLSTNSTGVFCRNLVLCRKINSVLVYGESLYQDNEKESRALMKKDMDLYGIQTNQRVLEVARCYYQGLMDYLGKGAE